jgi:hypothetical protein
MSKFVKPNNDRIFYLFSDKAIKNCNNTGVINSVPLGAGGSAYTEASVSVSGLNGSGTGAVITATISVGAITSFNIVSGGSGYVAPLSFTITGDGTGASVGTATVNTQGVCSEYRWNIPDIQLNDAGKLSLVSHTYKSFANTTTPVETSILYVGSKNIFDTAGGRGAILDISNWTIDTNTSTSPAVDLSPQVINNISLAIDEDMTVIGSGSTNSNVFCIVLKLTEGDVPRVEFGSTNNVNVNQRQIPVYN